MNKMKRNPLIDYARYFFAFLVVCIHVPLAHGGAIIWPFARCAVPFFYLVTGYFLGKACSDDKSILAFKLKKSCHKWLNLWLKYTLALLFISIILDVCLGQIESWTWNDTYTMLMSGVCAFIDQHEWKLQTYGISTLWFLYCGFLAFCIIYIMRKFVYTAWFLLIIIICQVSFVFFIYNGVTNWLFFYSTLPFLYYGMLIGHYSLLSGENSPK